nr:MAG: putative capsid protein [Arizlama virus]
MERRLVPVGARRTMLGAALASYYMNPTGWNQLAYSAGRAIRQYAGYARPSAPVSTRAVTVRAPARVSRAVSRVSPRAPTYRKKKGIKGKVRELERHIKSGQGTLIYRKRTTERLLAAVNQKSYGVMSGQVDMSSYETVLAELRFFNPASPGTLTQASGATGTYFRDYLFKSVASKCTAVNNYQVPVKVTVLCCMPREDTGINPATAFEQGLTDITAAATTSQLTYFTDSDEFNKLWRVVKSKKAVLQAGRKTVLNFATKNITFDPALFDSHTLAYQRKCKCYAYVVRVEGILGHDSSADQQGFLQGGVDITCDYTYTVDYNAGADIKYIVVSDGSDSFTNGGLVSSKPVADNIPYSVS